MVIINKFKTYWGIVISRVFKNAWGKIKDTMKGVLIFLLCLLLFLGCWWICWHFGFVQKEPEFEIVNEEIKIGLWSLYGLGILFCLLLLYGFLYIPVKIYFEQEAKIKTLEAKIKRNNKNKKNDVIKNPNKYQKISESKTNEIDISIKSKSSHSGQKVGLVITNNNKNKPVFCKAIIKKMDWYEEDPRKGNMWVPIDTEEFNALSWHYSGTDNDGFKKVHIKPEFLNIVNFPTSMSQQIIVGGIRWRFTFSFIHEEKEFFAGKYRMQIDIICKMNDEYKIESWFGCIDTPKARESSMDWSELSIWECEDVKNWK